MTVANHLFSDIMLKFGFPRMLHSGNGTEFKSVHIEKLSQQLGIRNIFISPHHLQGNRTRILTQIHQGLHAKLFCKWYP